MKSDIEIKDDVYAALKTTQLVQSINGVLSKRKRPLNSDKEDIIIAVLANKNSQNQTAYVNVNIYVPDQWEKDQYTENDARLRQLCELAEQALDGYHQNGVRMTIQQQTVLEVAEREHMINNRVFYQFNTE